MISIGEELERENPLLENSQLSPAINLMETQQPIPDDIVRNDEEDLQLFARARAVGMSLHSMVHQKLKRTGGGEGGEIKGEYLIRKEGCVKLSVIYHHLL